MNVLEKRIIELSYKHALTHISSCLNAVNLIGDIYDNRMSHEPFVLGNGHAALALFVVLEKEGLCDAEEMIALHGTHANRDIPHGIYVTCGSLGMSETVAVGLAMADLARRVWLVTSDGAAMEGSVYEALRIAGKFCPNLTSYILYNGHGAYGDISYDDLPKNTYVIRVGHHLPEFLQGIKGHYLTLNQEQYEECMA